MQACRQWLPLPAFGVHVAGTERAEVFLYTCTWLYNRCVVKSAAVLW